MVSQQVRDYLRSLAPEPRRQIRLALARLPAGDVKALYEELDGFQRLRVGGHRMVFRIKARRIEVVYAAPRSIVYEYLAAHFSDFKA